jgi:amino acid adenylation domain-containing protein
MRTFRGARHGFQLQPALRASLVDLSRRRGATLFMTLVAGLQALIHGYAGEPEVTLGTPIAGRERTELERLIGFFVNTLVLRSQLSGELRFADLIDQVRETTLQAYAHQDLPFELLVDELQLARDLAHSPLFQVMFVFQNVPQAQPVLPGLAMTELPMGDGNARFELTLSMADVEGRLVGWLEHNTDLFDATTARRLVGHLENLLTAAAADSDRTLVGLSLLSEAERHQLAAEWNDTAAGSPRGGRIPPLFAAWARRFPEAVAVICGGESIRYGELERRVNRLARHLRRLGVGPEVRVGLCFDRSVDLIVGLMGILSAGGAYVPLDPSHPDERLAFMISNSGLRMVVTGQPASRLPAGATLVRLDALGEDVAGEGGDPLADRGDGANLAYAIYTSGSTGEPKGVLVSHESLANLTRAFTEVLALAPGDRFLMMPSIGFDASAGDIFPALTAGATLVMHPNPGELSGEELRRLCDEEGITVLDIPAALWQGWVDDLSRRGMKGILPTLRRVIVGGESITLERLGEWSRMTGGRAPVMGAYGPTEATVCTTTCTAWNGAASDAGGARLPLGRPLANSRVCLLDRDLRPVPPGALGEIHIGGAGLARGYLDLPALTAQRFLPDPFGEPGSRLYRTGDLARWLPSGDLTFLGRVDDQVKIRGFRVEPGEVEALLLQHPGIREGAVIVREDRAGQVRLLAYLVPEEGTGVTAGEIRSALQRQLPAYMIPSAFVLLPALPLTPHGKIDRGALPVPDPPGGGGSTFVPPRKPVEQGLAAIWKELLGIEAVGVFDDFFELGGHSLLAAQLVSRVREAFLVELPLRTVFENPTVAGLAEALDRQRPEDSAKTARLAEILQRIKQLSADEVDELLAEK